MIRLFGIGNKRTISKLAEQTISEQGPEEPTWVIDMRDHYHRTGYYRATDLERVLGDPRDGVEVLSEETMRAASQPPE